jgi:hypothetical protein
MGHDTFAVLIMFQSSSEISGISDGLISKGAKQFKLCKTTSSMITNLCSENLSMKLKD